MVDRLDEARASGFEMLGDKEARNDFGNSSGNLNLRDGEGRLKS
jgi:hypothetical protein